MIEMPPLRPDSSALPLRPLRIIGFVVPAASDRNGVIQAELDGEPGAAWLAAFKAQSDALKARHDLDQIRVVGHVINLLGVPPDQGAVADDLRAIVHRVSRMAIERHVLGNDAAADTGSVVDVAARIAGLEEALRRDVESVSRIAAVPAILEAMARSTGMRFAAVARVTEARWTACAVYDDVAFGLLPGQDLVLETTICNEIRQNGQMVAFDDARSSETFRDHPTPARYGFRSYISIPISRPDGTFFGTLCAIDPEPARLDAATLAALRSFAELIGRELGNEEQAGAPA